MMSALAPAFEAELNQERALVTLLIEAVLPDYTLRLLAGTGVLMFNGHLFVGEDPRFGTMSTIDAIEDGEGDQAPSLSISFFPPDAVSAAQLCSPTYQGAPLKVWLAGVYRDTGTIIADPYLLFSGFIDQPTLRVGKGDRDVEFQCVSQFDILLEEDEGARLSDAFHQSIWPGETGFANVTGIENMIYWGVAAPQGDAVSYGNSYGSGRGEML